MFRSWLYATPLVCFLALGGCATTGGIVAPTIASVQAAAVAACSFLPTVATVASIIAAGNPAVITAGAIAEAICSALAASKSSARKRATVPVVGNVVIHGTYVRP